MMRSSFVVRLALAAALVVGPVRAQEPCPCPCPCPGGNPSGPCSVTPQLVFVRSSGPQWVGQPGGAFWWLWLFTVAGQCSAGDANYCGSCLMAEIDVWNNAGPGGWVFQGNTGTSTRPASGCGVSVREDFSIQYDGAPEPSPGNLKRVVAWAAGFDLALGNTCNGVALGNPQFQEMYAMPVP